MQAFLEKHFYLVNLVVIGLGAVLSGLVATSLIEYALVGDSSAKRRKRPLAGRGLGKERKPSKLAMRTSMFDVTRRNIFCSYCKPSKAVDAAGGGKKPSVSMDDAELLATQVAVNDDKWSIATIRFKKTSRMRLVAKGTKIDEYEITKVESKRVTFKRGKEIGYLDLFPDAGKEPNPAVGKPPPGRHKPRGPRDSWRQAVNQGVRKVGPNKYEIDRSLVQQFISNTAMAGRDAAIYPHTKNGKPDGFRLGRVRPGGIFAKLGMRSGDVLNSVNNMSITTLDKALEMFTKLQGANHMTIGLTRYGRPQSLDYTIK
jgi:type II secretory pathway component PulC